MLMFLNDLGAKKRRWGERAMGDVPNIGRLRFRVLDVRGRTSISTDLTDEEVSGIYAYEFDDGTWYIGKSIDVRDRHVQHLHDWRHKNPVLAPVRMLWASLRCSDKTLDFAETQAISYFEQEGYPLRNVMKTGRPRGNTEVIVDTEAGFGVPIPWERKNLPINKDNFKFIPDKTKKYQHKKLQAIRGYEKLLHSLAFYVKHTVPAPAHTAGKLWVATAMPSTNGSNRICCISCQNAETFVILKGGDEHGIKGFINMKRDKNGRLPRWKHSIKAIYGTLPKAYSMFFESQERLDRLLGRPHTLDCCYRANAELMRRGASMYGRFNNPYLVIDILEEIGK